MRQPLFLQFGNCIKCVPQAPHNFRMKSRSEAEAVAEPILTCSLKIRMFLYLPCNLLVILLTIPHISRTIIRKNISFPMHIDIPIYVGMFFGII